MSKNKHYPPTNITKDSDELRPYTNKPKPRIVRHGLEFSDNPAFIPRKPLLKVAQAPKPEHIIRVQYKATLGATVKINFLPTEHGHLPNSPAINDAPEQLIPTSSKVHLTGGHALDPATLPSVIRDLPQTPPKSGK